jgi:hypothetical protein
VECEAGQACLDSFQKLPVLRQMLLLSATQPGNEGMAELIWRIKKLKGKKPDRIGRLFDSHVRIVIGREAFDLSLQLVHLNQDIAVRTTAHNTIAYPLRRDGVDMFQFIENYQQIITITIIYEVYFKRPDILDQTLVGITRRAAFSIILLSFKEENKWRLYDGNMQISAIIKARV